MEKGTKGTITWGDGSTSKVEIDRIQTYPSTGMPTDYMFKYQEGETHQPLMHPHLEPLFPLPEFLVHEVFKED